MDNNQNNSNRLKSLSKSSYCNDKLSSYSSVYDSKEQNNDDNFISIDTEVGSTCTDDVSIASLLSSVDFMNDENTQKMTIENSYQQHGIAPAPFQKNLEQLERSITLSSTTSSINAGTDRIDAGKESDDEDSISFPVRSNYKTNEDFTAEDALTSAVILRSSFHSHNMSWKPMDMSEGSVSDLSDIGDEDDDDMSFFESRFVSEDRVIESSAAIAQEDCQQEIGEIYKLTSTSHTRFLLIMSFFMILTVSLFQALRSAKFCDHRLFDKALHILQENLLSLPIRDYGFSPQLLHSLMI